MVGPGTYKDNAKSIERRTVKGAHVYKGFHKEKDVANNGYYFVGCHLVYDPKFNEKTKRMSTT
jgi:hypothetical protein